MDHRIYQPLRTDVKQIRLLTLHPSAESTAQISGTLESADLESRPEYEAVSWCWGKKSCTGPMTLNGVRVDIPRNLEEALRQFRFSDQPRKLWADAVCINQSDPQEKPVQLRLMGDIYGIAARTLVWLGPMKNDTDQFVFESLNRLSHGISFRQIILERAGRWTSSERCSDDEMESLFEGQANTEGQYEDTDLLDRLSDFFSLEWWERLWVLQEVALASEAQLWWGDSCMDFNQLKLCCDKLLAEFRDEQTILESILGRSQRQEFLDLLEGSMNTVSELKHIYDLNCGTEATMSQRNMCFLMIEILAKGRTRKASIPHDKVYGLLGLVPPRLMQRFQPDYDLPANKVFSNTAYLFLDLSRSFMLFNCIREGFRFPPSWSPDWNYRYHQILDFRLRAQQEQLFQACDNAAWHLTRRTSYSNELAVKGFRLDVVRGEWLLDYDVLDAASLYQFLEGGLYLLLGGRVGHFDDSLYAHKIDVASVSQRVNDIRNTNYITGIGILEAVSRIALNDCEPSPGIGPIRRLSANNSRRFEEWLSTVDQDGGLAEYNPEVISNSEAISFEGTDNRSMCDFARSATRGKSFFTTKLGYAGLKDYEPHQKDRPFDEVWVLAGGSQPVVLQPDPDEKGAYHVISEAYMHGVMDGEAARGEVPVLPESGDPEQVKSDLHKGCRSWPQPEFITIYIK